LEAERVKAEKALRKEKRGKESDFCLIESFFALYISDLLILLSWRPAPRPTRSCRSFERWPRPPPRRSFTWSGRLGEV